MSWTKFTFYLSLIVSVIVVFVSLGNMGTDLANKDDIVLDSESYDYILELKGVNEDSNYDTIVETSAKESSDEDILQGDINSSVSTASDFLSSLKIKQERARKPTNFFYTVYNIPSTLVKGLRLPISGFEWLINLFVFVLVIAGILMVWREVRA